MRQKDCDILIDEITRLRCDSIVLDATMRHYAKWHWQLDNGTKQSIDSMIKADRRQRVVKHIAKPE
jgi:hypothetical protein